MLRLVLLRFLESYFRHRWLWLIPIVVMAGVGALSVVRTKPVYMTRGTMYVQKTSLLASLTATRAEGFSWVTPAQAASNDIKELLQTESFVRAVIKQTALEPEMSKEPGDAWEAITTVRGAVWVRTLGDNLLEVGATHEDAEIAHQLTVGTIEGYLQWKINDEKEESSAAQTFFSELIKSYSADLETARGTLDKFLQDHPDPVRGNRSSLEEQQISRLEANVTLATDRLESALSKEENTRLSLATSESGVRQKYFVIDAPVMPESASNSKKGAVMGSLVFVVVGAILSVVGVAGGALVDGTCRFPVDVRLGVGLPVLAVVPDGSVRGKAAKKPKKEAA